MSYTNFQKKYKNFRKRFQNYQKVFQKNSENFQKSSQTSPQPPRKPYEKFWLRATSQSPSQEEEKSTFLQFSFLYKRIPNNFFFD
jgi:hypothetical protein